MPGHRSRLLGSFQAQAVGVDERRKRKWLIMEAEYRSKQRQAGIVAEMPGGRQHVKGTAEAAVARDGLRHDMLQPVGTFAIGGPTQEDAVTCTGRSDDDNLGCLHALWQTEKLAEVDLVDTERRAKGANGAERAEVVGLRPNGVGQRQ